jgi:hypothetical protein
MRFWDGTVRDDFSQQTKMEIAKSVGYRCTNPDCTRPTVSANAAQDGIITIGVAAHICAASAGGPRYNALQTSEARRAKDNGIWLCQNCGKLIDSDETKFTEEVLRDWKRDAQARAFRELVAPSLSAPTEEAARFSSVVAADNMSDVDAEFDKLFAATLAAAEADLGAYKRTLLWREDAVELTLSLYDGPAAPPFSIGKLPLAVEAAPEVTMVAPPGTGKTTTLLQLAGHAIADQSIVPLYFRLGDWATGSLGLLASLHQRSSFKNVRPDDILRLAGRGRMLLLLDGWNELDLNARRRLRVELEQIRRDHPSLRIVATTRRQALDVPIAGPRIAIEPLSEEQQIAIARARAGEEGRKIVDDAWRTAGVRELVTIPLYLSALLASGTRGVHPTTKEECFGCSSNNTNAPRTMPRPFMRCCSGVTLRCWRRWRPI